MGVLNLNSGTGSPSTAEPKLWLFGVTCVNSGWLSFRGRIGRQRITGVAFVVAHLLLIAAREFRYWF